MVTVNATGKPVQTTAIKLNTTTNVDFVMVGLATNQTNSGVYPTGGIFMSGTQSGQIYTVTNVTGLQANQQYSLRVILYQQN